MKTKTLKQLIKAKKFDYVTPHATEEKFPPKPIRGGEYSLLDLKPMSHGDTLKEIDRLGYEPANVYELLAWDGWDGRDWVVALGQSRTAASGDRYFLYLRRLGVVCKLDGVWIDPGEEWSGDWRFLVRAKDKRGTEIKERTSDIHGRLKEWICPRGIGHHRGLHGCDGCCEHEPLMEQTTLEDTRRVFETGATRNKDDEKLDIEAFFSPAVLKRRAEFMHENRKLEDGTLRDGDNWQKGIPIDAYMKSMTRHFVDVWLHHRGGKPMTEEDIETSLCALMFNAEGMLYELLKKK